jgi:hypothetical protein
VSLRGDVFERFAALFRADPTIGPLLEEDLVTALSKRHGPAVVLTIDGSETDDEESESFQAVARALPVKVSVVGRTQAAVLDAAELVESFLLGAMASRYMRNPSPPTFAASGADEGGPVFTASWSLELFYRFSAGDATLEV